MHTLNQKCEFTDGLQAAPMPRSSREFLQDGCYVAQIQMVKKRRSEKKRGTDGLGELLIIIEMVIVDVLQAKTYQAFNQEGEWVDHKSNQKGDLVVQVIKMHWPKAYSSVKGFLAAAMELEPSQIMELEQQAGAWGEIMARAVHVLGGEIAGNYLDESGNPKGEGWVVQPLNGVQVEVRAHTKNQRNKSNASFTEIEYFKKGSL